MKKVFFSLLLLFSIPVYGQNFVIELSSPNLMKSGVFGKSIIMVNDMTGDGVPDFIISAPGELNSGRVYFFDGVTHSSYLELASPNPELYGGFGISLENIGDLNNDGIDDILVGALNEDPGNTITDAGRVYCFSGKDTSLIHEIKAPIELNRGNFGRAISSIGDLNDDGIIDFIINNDGFPPTVYVISGKDTSIIYTLKSPKPVSTNEFGHMVGSAGDLNDDGYDEILISALGEETIYIFSGINGEVLNTIKSPYNHSFVDFGRSFDSGVDLNNDDIPDIIVGSPKENPTLSFDTEYVGRAFVFSGADLSLIHELKSPIEQEKSMFGLNVAFGGDMNRDGVPEILVTTMEPPEGTPSASGKVHVFSGKDFSFFKTLSSLNEKYGGCFGYSISADLDLDKDGSSDILIGAEAEDEGSLTYTGHVYLFDGSITTKLEKLLVTKDQYLLENYPNPFNPMTKIKFNLPNYEHVLLKIYNIKGQEIRTLMDQNLAAGQYEVEFDGNNLASGIYLYKIILGNYIQTNKMLLLK